MFQNKVTANNLFLTVLNMIHCQWDFISIKAKAVVSNCTHIPQGSLVLSEKRERSWNSEGWIGQRYNRGVNNLYLQEHCYLTVSARFPQESGRRQQQPSRQGTKIYIQ